MECWEASRMSSMRLWTLYLASSEETWNFTVRSDKFSSLAISLLARLRRMPSRTSSSRFEKFLGFFGEPAYAIGSCLNHDEVVAGRLSANHAMHGQEAGRVIDRKFAIRARLDVEMGCP
jgi:hypothetical protein